VRSKLRRFLTCHHEAGHALVRWYFGYRTSRVVVLSPEQIFAGKQLRNSRGKLIPCEGLVEGYDICSYPFGPVKISGGPEEQAACDRDRAVLRDIDLVNCYAGFVAEARYRHVSAAAAMLAGGLQDTSHAWTILEAWPLRPDERAELEAVAFMRARALVGSPKGSSAITAIAKALRDRGRLSGLQVARLCRDAYDGRECSYGAWMTCWPPTLAQIRDGYIPERRLTRGGVSK